MASVPVNEPGKVESMPFLLEIVGSCPMCGSPVYGKRTLFAGETPQVQHSCNCLWNKTVRGMMQTK